MINSLTQHTATASAPERSSLADQLAKRVDTNRDGAVTTVEFDAFLSDLMRTLESEGANRPSAGPAAQTAASAPATNAQPVDAATVSSVPARSAALNRAIAATKER